MQNYKITLQYDGTKYNGWQKQKNTQNTIQGKLEAVLTKMVGTEIEVFGSGRTDTGVHALGQVANFKTLKTRTCEEIRTYLNQYLPKDIKVINIEEVEPRFHSRLCAKRKTYLYRLYVGEKPNVFERKFVYNENLNLDVKKIKEATNYLIGEKDFKAFCSLKNFKKSTVRTIYSIDVLEENQEIKFIFYGNGFLYNMVRILVGTLVEVGLGNINPSEIQNIILSKNRQLAGKTMPPCGLFLVNVEY